MKIITKYDPPPIPVRCFDWSAVFDGYEPGQPIGWGYTEEQARADLLDCMEHPEDYANAKIICERAR